MSKKQPREFDSIVAMVRNGDDKETVISAAVSFGYTENSATIMFYKAQQQVQMQKVKRIFRGRVPTKDTFVKRATQDVGMRPTSAMKRYDEYVNIMNG